MFKTKCFLLCLQISEQPLFVPGVWGPCLSAMVPGMWLNEGGQSATGRLVCVPKSSFMQHDMRRQMNPPQMSVISIFPDYSVIVNGNPTNLLPKGLDIQLKVQNEVTG